MRIPFAALLLAMPATAGRERPERWYQERIAASLEGRMETRVPNGRVDVETATHAVEVEFAPAWKQSIGQALWYAFQTSKKPGIVLVIPTRRGTAPMWCGWVPC